MTKRKPCPAAVQKLGAALVRARRSQERAADDALEARRLLVDEVIPEMVKHGAKEMEAGLALSYLCEAARGHGLLGAAHDSLRGVLVRLGFEEPTDKDILSLIGDGDISVMGGGGSRRGGR